MPKVYNSTWKVKPLSINFNHKIWRQDLGAYVRSKLFWDGTTRVSRARTINKSTNLLITKGIKSFEIYNAYGGSVKVEFQNNNEVLHTTHEDLIKNYFLERGLK